MTMQLSFLEPHSQIEETKERPLREALADIVWSYSRRSTLERCVRRYYYEYYGANKRTAKGDQDKNTLHVLKQLKSRHERAGEILHLAIGVYLKKARLGNIWESSSLAAWARNIFRKDISYSRTRPAGDEPPTEKYPPVLLSEFYYRDPRATEVSEQSCMRLEETLVAFVADQRYQPFRIGARSPEAVIEEPFKERGLLPCRIDGKIDLAYQSGDEVCIVDWKLGKDDGVSDDSLQLATYALWAVGHYRCAAQALRICKVHLGSGTIVDFRCDDALLAATRARILQDAERMLLLEPYGMNAIVGAFSPSLHLKVCESCPFRKVCPEGKELLYA